MEADEALIETTKDITTLGELLEYCASLNTCKYSAEFWKQSLTRLFGNMMVLQRGDLETAEEWYEFALALNEGRRYDYCIVSEDGDNFDPEARPFRSVVDLTSELIYERIDVIGSLPVQGARGYLARIFVDSPHIRFGDDAQTTLFMDFNLKVAHENATRYMVEQVHYMIRRGVPRRAAGGRGFVIVKIKPNNAPADYQSVYQELPSVRRLTDLVTLHKSSGLYISWIDEAGPEKTAHFGMNIYLVEF